MYFVVIERKKNLLKKKQTISELESQAKPYYT